MKNIEMSEIDICEIKKEIKITSVLNWINFQVHEEYFPIFCFHVSI